MVLYTCYPVTSLEPVFRNSTAQIHFMFQFHYKLPGVLLVLSFLKTKFSPVSNLVHSIDFKTVTLVFKTYVVKEVLCPSFVECLA